MGTYSVCSTVLAFLFSIDFARAQLPVEVFGGNKKLTADIMFFKYIKNKEGQHTKFLFFNRNRASVDYKMTTTTNLPQFGFTEAFSYNHAKWKGFAPVVVVSILNRGVYPKAGVQFAKANNTFTLFSWIVTETLKEPNLDLFILTRYTPGQLGKLNLFWQLELFNTFPTAQANVYSFVQRVRLGLKINALQFGAGVDLSQSGRTYFTNTENAGIFIRYEF